MTLQAKIERDLSAGPSSVSALASRLGVSADAVQSVLERLQREELVRARTICDHTITVWSLKNQVNQFPN